MKADIDGFQDPRGAAYKTGAAVSYRTATGRRRLIALALDADRTYRIAFVEDVPASRSARRGPRPSTGPPAPSYARCATATATPSWAWSAAPTDSGSDPTRRCALRVSDAPFRRELVGNARVRPVALGGNSQVAFYKLRTRPDAYYTMVMARGERARRRARGFGLVTALPAD